MKATMARYPRVKLTAIQDDIDIMGPPDQVFGPVKEDADLTDDDDPGAMRHLLQGLAAAGLQPNQKKFQLLASTERAAASAPSWLGRLRPFHITDAAHRGHLEELEQAAEEAARRARLPTASAAER